MVKYITLCGRKQTGKDTSARYIKYTLTEDLRHNIDDWYNSKINGPAYEFHQVHITHYADALKKACSAIFNIPLEDMETETGKKKLTDIRWPKRHELFDASGTKRIIWLPDPNGRLMTVREILQYVGTNLFRTQMDPDVWVRSVYRKKYSDDSLVIIADCRFPNEADIAREHGILIKLERSTGLENDIHMSETALDGYKDYDYVVDNNGSYKDLYKQLNYILRHEGILA